MQGGRDGATARCIFQTCARNVVKSVRHREIDDEARNAAAGFGRHVFLDASASAIDLPAFALASDCHRRQHATRQRSRQQIGGRKGSAPTLVVDRGIGLEFDLGGSVHRRRMQSTFVDELHFNHRPNPSDAVQLLR